MLILLLDIWAVVAALIGVGSWVYGIYCWFQTIRHRKANLPVYGIVLSPDQLTPVGRVFLRRQWWSIGIGLGAGVLASILGSLTV